MNTHRGEHQNTHTARNREKEEIRRRNHKKRKNSASNSCDDDALGEEGHNSFIITKQSKDGKSICVPTSCIFLSFSNAARQLSQS
jgi:hypothetical protein